MNAVSLEVLPDPVGCSHQISDVCLFFQLEEPKRFLLINRCSVQYAIAQVLDAVPISDVNPLLGHG